MSPPGAFTFFRRDVFARRVFVRVAIVARFLRRSRFWGRGREAVVFAELSNRRRYVSRRRARLRFFARRVFVRVAYRRASLPSFAFLVWMRSFLSSYPAVGGTFANVGRVYAFSPRRWRTLCFRLRSLSSRKPSVVRVSGLGTGGGRFCRVIQSSAVG